MNLQKKLIQLSEYKCSFKYVDSYFLVSMTYPDAWSIIPSEDRSIEVAEENGITFYAAPIETDIDNAFRLIDDTIAYNLDVEKKMALLKYNIGKLQEIFAEKDLEELETLKFIFAEKTTKKVQKKSSTKKVTRKKTNVTPKTEIEEVKEIIPSEDRFGNAVEENYSPIDEGEDSVIALNVSESMPNKYLEEVER